MRKKVTAAILILANVISLASCTVPGRTEVTEEETDAEEKERSNTEEKIYSNIEKITADIAGCDFEDLCKRCTTTPYEVLEVMPVIEEPDADGNIHVSDNMLLIRNMIATTLTCKIDEESFKGSIIDKKYSVDVKFSFKDYERVSGLRDRFLGAADFNSLLLEEPCTVDKVLTLEFVKQDRHYLLSNPEILTELYDYDLPELVFMKNCFDMIETSYMSGPGWDTNTESFFDTNTLEFHIVLDHQAREYIWQYVYAVSEETTPEWRHIYTSDIIVDKYPTEINLIYTQEENFSTGYYCFIIYDVQSEEIYGWEFSIYNTEEPLPTAATTTTSTAEETEETEETQ